MKDQNQSARQILLASPPGQFDLILGDLRSALSESSGLIDDDFVGSVRSEWEASTNRSVLTSKEAVDGDASISSLHTAIDEYLSKFSSSNIHTGHQVTNAVGSIIITIYVEKIDPNNFRTGSWTGKYTLNNTTGSFSASVDIHTHTFEDGANFHLKSKIDTSAVQVGSCPPDGEKLSAWTLAIVRTIKAWEEEEIMSKLREMYDSMGGSLKSLRRVIPVTRMKMDWDVMSHRVVRMLGEKEEKREH